MKCRKKTEAEILEIMSVGALDVAADMPERFIVKLNKERIWEVEFSYRNCDNWKVTVRREDEVRQFRRWEGVLAFMEKIGVKEFVVTL